MALTAAYGVPLGLFIVIYLAIALAILFAIHLVITFLYTMIKKTVLFEEVFQVNLLLLLLHSIFSGAIQAYFIIND